MASEEGDYPAMEWSTELSVHSWEDAFEKGREFSDYVDAIGQGTNAARAEWEGRTGEEMPEI